MIRDVLIMAKSGLPLFHQHFGECHSFGRGLEIESSFISALQIFSNELTGSEMRMLELTNKKLIFHQTPNNIFAVLCEKADMNTEIISKAQKISELFETTYSEELCQFNGDVNLFHNFRNQLIELNIAQNNCGGRPECNDCPNSQKTHQMESVIKELNNRQGFFEFLRSKIFKKTTENISN